MSMNEILEKNWDEDGDLVLNYELISSINEILHTERNNKCEENGCHYEAIQLGDLKKHL